jgi:type I restriction enzyme R subunit
MLCERPDVIVLTDEAHRSQYDTLALNMRAALPKALFLAFTGTPLIAGEERTREVFGDYVSIYDFQQSVEDNATVRLFYENRTPELRLKNPDLNEDIYAAVEAADLDEDQERRLERELGRQYHLLTRDDRLETVAKDVVHHFLGRGFQGKAMVVSIDKATALRMYDKVRKYWQAEQASAEEELARLTTYGEKRDPDRVRELRQRLDTLTTTDMALIVSPGQNEIEQMKALGLDIVPHRKRMHDEALDEKFKDPKDPLRLVFICAMWLTGFDVPSCSTIYLDKPMRNHSLMQAIARANRVFPGKHSGLIVDYANVFASLERALAIYAMGQAGTTPVRSKQQLVEELRAAVEAATTFCGQHGVHLSAIETLPTGSLERLTQIADAVDRLISPDPLRKDFLAHEKWVSTLFRAVKPDPAVMEFSGKVSCLSTIAEVIRDQTGEEPADISAVMTAINGLLDASIAADGFRIQPGAPGSYRSRGTIDISAIDFETLAKRFAKAQRKNVELEQLRAAVRAQLECLVQVNPTRADYQARFQELIDSYNAGSRNIEEIFKELLALSRALSDEQERHVREQLTEEELTVFDLLTRPGPDLGPEERDEVKKVARRLLERVRAALVLDWRQRAQARAQVRLAIEDTLDEGLPRAFTPEIYQAKCAILFEHVFESFGDASVPA